MTAYIAISVKNCSRKNLVKYFQSKDIFFLKIIPSKNVINEKNKLTPTP